MATCDTPSRVTSVRIIETRRIAHAAVRRGLIAGAVLIGSLGYGQVALFRGKASLAGLSSSFWFQYADMNGDGKTDAVSCVTPTSQIGIHLGNGKGAFAMPRLFPALVGQGSTLALADM